MTPDAAASGPILPIDTVQAVVESAYPWLLARLRGDPKPKQADDAHSGRGAEAYRAQTETLLKQKAPLEDPKALTAWFGHRLALDGVPATGVLNPFAGDSPAFTVSTSAALTRTYALHPGGIVLPRTFDAHDRPDASGDAATLDALAKEIPEAAWIVLGTQMDLLRVAASLATVLLWRSSDFGKADKERFPAKVLAQYNSLRVDARAPELPVRFLGRRVHLDWVVVSGARYYNPEDGAGYLTRKGYTLFEPSPPPALDGWISPSEDVWGGGLHPLDCGFYATRHAYATPCSCTDARVRFFEPTRMRDSAPEEES